MYRDPLYSQLGQFGQKIQRIFHHQVHIQGLAGQAGHGAHHIGAEGDGRHKMAVHDVDVESIHTGGFGGADVLFQMGKVGGQNGCTQFKHYSSSSWDTRRL